MLAGVAGACIGVTAKVLEPAEPQAFDTDTTMLPLAVPVVTVIELLVELPLHPPGKVHA